jgi:enolase
VLTIETLHAIEILDSRSRPTLSVTVGLADGTGASAGVPSGASTGSGEAVELRDGDPARYGGQGVRRAVANVNGELADALRGRTFGDLAAVDQAMIELDGTPTKSRLGANAIVGISMAVARAAALSATQSLWRYLTPAGVSPRLPWPSFNVLNGGVHAPNSLDFQEFMVTPLGASNMREAVRAGAEVYAALRRRLADAGHATGLGDEGGFAPGLNHPAQVLDLMVAAIADAGYPTGKQGVAIALDPASSEFFRDGAYQVAGESLSTDDMIVLYDELTTRYPIWNLEDGLAESDWDGWKRLNDHLGGRLQIVGDDILVTNPGIIAKAIDANIANAALIKVNQIGTVTETLEAFRLCRDAGWGAMVSHRSGETPDAFIADLVVGSGCGQIKSGAPARGERVAKYNRLLEIADGAPELPYGAAT